MNFFKNSSHLIVSLLLIFNQLGFDFNLHYCGDSFSSISFLNQSKNCGMHLEEVDKSNNDMFSDISKSCCSDSKLNTDLIDVQVESVFKINKQELSNSSFINQNLNEAKLFPIWKFLFEKPPPINKNKKYLLFVQLIYYA